MVRANFPYKKQTVRTPDDFKIKSAEPTKEYQSFNDWMKTMSIFDAYKYKHI